MSCSNLHDNFSKLYFNFNKDRDVLSAVILLYGADPEVQDFEGKTAAELARMNGNVNVLEAMKDPEAYLRAKGYTGTDDEEL